METKKIFSFNSRDITFTRRITSTDAPYTMATHSHPLIEIVVVNGGTHGYTVEGREITISPCDVIIIEPGVPHCVRIMPGDYDRYSIIIPPSLLPHGTLERLVHGVSTLGISRGDEISLLLEKAERYSRELPPEVHGKIYPTLAIELVYMLLSKIPNRTPTNSEVVNRALAYIDKHYAEIRSISEICDRLYISKSRFHSLFRENLGKTPLTYLNERRLYQANARIAAGARPTEVYRECGFIDYTSFFRSFKRLYGHAPSSPQFTPDNESDDF